MTGANELLFRRVGNALLPASHDAAQFVNSLEQEERAWLTGSKKRSLRQHRLFWALLKKVGEATEFHTAEALLAHLKVRLGKFTPIGVKGLKTPVAVLHSTSFEKMKQAEFQKFFDDCVYVIVTEILGVGKDDAEYIERTKADLLAEVNAMLGPEFADGH